AQAADARAGQQINVTQMRNARAGYDVRPLIMLVRAWEDAQGQRKRNGNRLGAIERYGGKSPALEAHVAAELAAEKALSRAIEREMRAHPMHQWVEGIKGLGAHNFGIVLALLEGDPYIAYPKVWVDNAGGKRRDGHEKKRELVALEPRVRNVSQLWSYAALNPNRP